VEIILMKVHKYVKTSITGKIMKYKTFQEWMRLKEAKGKKCPVCGKIGCKCLERGKVCTCDKKKCNCK
jgi:hypothetical protein